MEKNQIEVDVRELDKLLNEFSIECLNSIPEKERICNRCFKKEENKIEEKRNVEDHKMQQGLVCTECGKGFLDQGIKYCSACGNEVKFKNFCYNCQKPTFTKFCTDCGGRIFS